MTEELLTYRDAYEHLLDVLDLAGQDSDRLERSLKRAITEAYRKLPELHDWRYFQRVTMVHTSPAYNTGTIEYSSSTNKVTLSGGVWPDDAEFSHLIVDQSTYKVLRRESDTVIELDTNYKPSADIAAGTTYRLGRLRYLLPVDVGDVRAVMNTEQTFQLQRMQTAEIFWHNSAQNLDAFPTGWSMIRSEDYPGRWELWLSTVDSTTRELRVHYDARNISLPVFDEREGTVSVSDGGDTATFSSSVLTSDFVGAVLRIGRTGSPPTPRVGSYSEASGNTVVRLPDHERVITQYTTSTTCVLSRPVTPAVSGKGYTLSSIIDVNPSGMWELFLRIAESQYDIITRADQSKQVASERAMIQALRVAMIADGRRIDGVDTGYSVSRLDVSNTSVT